MFAIENLWKIDALKPLQKAYEANNADHRIVIAKRLDDVDVAATQALHEWLATFSYEFIPGTWETAKGEELPVVHVSKMTLRITRRNPFNGQPLPPHSWLAKLPQERFDALLLAQQQGNVPFAPNEMYITDTLRPALTADALSEFWRKAVTAVQFAQSGAAAQNDEQRRLINTDWPSAMKRRHYDPAVATVSPAPVAPSCTASVKVRAYQWYDDGQRRWNWRHIQLRKWIANRVDSAAGFRQLAADVFGKSYHLDLGGSIENAAHALVREAENHDMLSMLATLVEFELQLQQPTTSAFNQTDQTVCGTQINTNGGAFVGGSVVIGGDFVGGNVIIGDKIVRR
jgi:hypothetical protein